MKKILAQTYCSLIPASCPFNRSITLFNRTYTIPPLCSINPYFDQIMNLRFKCLVYLDSL